MKITNILILLMLIQSLFCVGQDQSDTSYKPYDQGKGSQSYDFRFSFGVVSSITSAPLGVHLSIDTDDWIGLYMETKLSTKLFTREEVDRSYYSLRSSKDWNEMIINGGIQISVRKDLCFYIGGGVNRGTVYSMGKPMNDGTYTWVKTDEDVVFPNFNTGAKLYVNSFFVLIGADISFIDQRDMDFGYQDGYNNSAQKYSLNLGVGYSL